MKEYVIIRSGSWVTNGSVTPKEMISVHAFSKGLEEMEGRVNDYVDQGYKPIGGLVVVNNELLQAMVKKPQVITKRGNNEWIDYGLKGGGAGG